MTILSLCRISPFFLSSPDIKKNYSVNSSGSSSFAKNYSCWAPKPCAPKWASLVSFVSSNEISWPEDLSVESILEFKSLLLTASCETFECRVVSVGVPGDNYEVFLLSYI